MAAPGKIKLDLSNLGLAYNGWRLAAKYGQWCRELIERNKKLETKLRIRSAKLGAARAEVREYRSWTAALDEQRRELGRQLEQARADALREAELRETQPGRNADMERLLADALRQLRELEEKNNAAG